jgi:hypothetical protein
LPQPDEPKKRAIERQYVHLIALSVALLVAFPPLYALLAAPPGASYLGFQFATDDHMVYSAWMRQAMDGRLLMENLFAVDPQPGLTIHLYFFALGLVAKATGIPLAAHLARIAFSVLFVYLVHALIRRITKDVFTATVAVFFVVLGGGLGFLMWHNFGVELVREETQLFRGPLLGRLPTDVWQPEGFVFPSMLTNGLFMASLCLIVFVFLSLLDARHGWRPVLPGALAMMLLMNIHSYDVLLIGLVMVAFLVMSAVRRQASLAWIGRALVIAAGALPSAAWFVYVLRHDAVFQARAATPTFAPSFRQLAFAYGLMILLALFALLRHGPDDPRRRQLRAVGTGILGLSLLVMWVLSAGHSDGYWMGLAAWLAVFGTMVAAAGLLSDEEPAWNLIVAWALVGLIAPYFPALFQRKLTMGLSVPWAILAACGLALLVSRQERGARNLATALGIIVLSATGIRWHFREWRVLASQNVTNTVVHPVYIGHDVQRAIAYLNGRERGERIVVVAMPGIANPVVDQRGEGIPDEYREPYLPDLNPVLTGFAGVFTYAGHWSETPDYGRRRDQSTRIFLMETSDELRRSLLEAAGADYVLAPIPDAFRALPLADLRRLGEVVAEGSRFALVKLPAPEMARQRPTD